MIQTYEELKNCLRKEGKLYTCYTTSKKKLFQLDFIHHHQRIIWKYIKYLRISEYLLNSKGFRPIKTILLLLNERRRNKIGNNLGLMVSLNTCDEGLFIEHIGSIDINPHSKIGKNFHVHGDVVIGTTGYSSEAPTIGDNVDIGCGAIVRGGIIIANNTIIGANAVVTKDIVKPNTIWCGVPAKEIGENKYVKN